MTLGMSLGGHREVCAAGAGKQIRLAGLLGLIGLTGVRYLVNGSAFAMTMDKMETLRNLADSGDLDAQVRLAFQLMKGELIERNLAQAAHYYELAAEQGSAAAQHNLATMFLHGQGVTRSEDLAVHWFELAAAQNDVDAMFALALIYEERDLLDDAFKWYQCAAENGSARAQYDLAVIYHAGKGRDKDIEKAIFWYDKSARQGVRRAEQALQQLNERK